MVELDAFMPYVQPHVGGCTDILAEQMVRDVCIDFASKSLIVQTTLDPVNAVQGLADYDLDAPGGTQVQMILRAWYGRSELAVANTDTPALRPEMFNPGFTGADTGNGRPRLLLQQDEKTFRLDPAPNESLAGHVTLLVATRPTRTALLVDDILFNDFAYEIGQGVVARLLRMPGQPFTNPQLAQSCEAVYVVARNAALLRAMRSFGRGRVQVNLGRL